MGPTNTGLLTRRPVFETVIDLCLVSYVSDVCHVFFNDVCGGFSVAVLRCFRTYYLLSLHPYFKPNHDVFIEPN